MRYRTIVVDPPWAYEEFATQSRSGGKWTGTRLRVPLPYPSMTVAEIGALPVGDLAERDARLFLWTTNRYLPDAFSVLGEWGFIYRQQLVWHKRDGNMGGSVAPNSAEFLLVATKGSPPRIGRWPSSVVVTAAPKQHSRKPEVFMDLVETVSPGPFLEMFSRRARFGWDFWGDEALGDPDLFAGLRP